MDPLFYRRRIVVDCGPLIFFGGAVAVVRRQAVHVEKRRDDVLATDGSGNQLIDDRLHRIDAEAVCSRKLHDAGILRVDQKLSDPPICSERRSNADTGPHDECFGNGLAYFCLSSFLDWAAGVPLDTSHAAMVKKTKSLTSCLMHSAYRKYPIVDETSLQETGPPQSYSAAVLSVSLPWSHSVGALSDNATYRESIGDWLDPQRIGVRPGSENGAPRTDKRLGPLLARLSQQQHERPGNTDADSRAMQG